MSDAQPNPPPHPHRHPHDDAHARQHACCGASAPADAAPEAVATPSDGRTQWRIPTMDCAAEESEIRHALERIPGIRMLSFRLGQRTLTIDADADARDAALAAIRRAGFSPVPFTAAVASDAATHTHGHDHKHDHDHDHDHDHEHGHGHASATPTASGAPSAWQGLVRYGIALVFAAAAELISYLAPDVMPWRALGMAVAAIAIALAGFGTYQKGFAALRRGRLNINALMTVAVTGAFVIGQWPEAAMVMALYAIAELIEARSVDRARNAIGALMALAPDEAEVRASDGQWQRVRAEEVALGSIVRIKPGERVPLDGVVIDGQSAIDQASVTGESIPVDKTAGDAVFAGTINQTGVLECRVTATAGNSTLARIIDAVEAAQGSRAPTQRFVDRFAAIYTPIVFLIALSVALGTPWLFGFSWHDAAYKALVLLVIACPCALVISTPVTIVSALSSAARQGILIKGGTHLENARNLKAVAFDKTGTVTHGKPALVAFEMLRSTSDETQSRIWAAGIAGHSDHPVSQAIAAGLGVLRSEVREFTALAGRGVEAAVDGTRVLLGNHRLIEERALCSAAVEERLFAHEAMGRTVTLLASSEGVHALMAVADTIKPSSTDAVTQLRALGVQPVMLSGDNAATAAKVAADAGISEARGNLLPEDKQQALKDLQARYGMTAMVGDGINDAPALAQSDLGIAMGAAGTDIAMEAADVVVMNDDLRRIPTLVRLSQRTHTVLWQNISLALGIKAVFLLWAVLGNATMWMAVFADMGASLIVVANGLRLLRPAADGNAPASPATA